ncbi:MAG TPA: DUF3857 domain-containing protein [Lysobacter sp.]
MRMLLGVLALLLAGVTHAQEGEYQRGEYRFKVGPEPAFVQRHEVPAVWEADAPGATGVPWRYWLYDLQSDNRGGRTQYYVEHVFEPKSASLLGEAGRFQIQFNPGYQQLAIHRVELRRGGQWQSRLVPDRISLARRETAFEQDMADGEVTALIVLDDVRVDDVIRISFSITGGNPVLAGNTTDSMAFGWRNPVLDTYLRVLFDAGSQLNVQRENNAPVPVIRDVDGHVESQVHRHAAPAYAYEDNYPLWYQPYPVVRIALKRSWGDVVDWALPLYPAVGTLPPDLEANIAQWRKLGTPEAKLKAALRAVQDQIRYFGVEMGENSHRPTPPADTWTRRYGDCKDKTYLLVTLLGRLGIPAVPALVSTSRGRGIADFTPAASAFNHVIVRAQVGKETVWVDPTLTAEGGDPRDSDQSVYGVALPVAKGVTDLQQIQAPRRSSVEVVINERYQPSADGREVALKVETVYQGWTANEARRSFASQRIDETARRYADHYRQRFGDLSPMGAPTFEDDKEINRLKVVEQYVLRMPFENEGTLKALNVYAEVLSKASELPPSISRAGPLFFGRPLRYRQEMQVDLPEKWKPTFHAEGERYSSAAFAYSRDVQVDPGRVRLVYDMQVLAQDIPPEKVSQHVGELRKVRDSLSARLRFQPPADVQREDRDARLKALLKNVMEEGGAR